MNKQSAFINEESDEKIMKENEKEKLKELKRKRNRERQRAYYHRQKDLKKNEKKEKKEKKKVPKSNAERQRKFRQRRKRQKLDSNEKNVMQCRAVENIENVTLQENQFQSQQLQIYEQCNECITPEVILHGNTGIPGDVTTSLQCHQCEENIKNNERVYKCVECVDVLMCAACEPRDTHQRHCIVRFPSTRIYDQVKDLFESLQKEIKMKLSVISDNDIDIHNAETEETLHEVLSDKYVDKNIKFEKRNEGHNFFWTGKVESMVSDEESAVRVPKIETIDTDPLEPQQTDLKYAPMIPKCPQLLAPNKLVTETVVTSGVNENYQEILIKVEPDEVDMEYGRPHASTHAIDTKAMSQMTELNEELDIKDEPEWSNDGMDDVNS